MTVEEIKAMSVAKQEYEERLHSIAAELRTVLDQLEVMSDSIPDCEDEDTRLDRIIELVR